MKKTDEAWCYTCWVLARWHFSRRRNRRDCWLYLMEWARLGGALMAGLADPPDPHPAPEQKPIPNGLEGEGR